MALRTGRGAVLRHVPVLADPVPLVRHGCDRLDGLQRVLAQADVAGRALRLGHLLLVVMAAGAGLHRRRDVAGRPGLGQLLVAARAGLIHFLRLDALQVIFVVERELVVARARLAEGGGRSSSLAGGLIGRLGDVGVALLALHHRGQLRLAQLLRLGDAGVAVDAVEPAVLLVREQAGARLLMRVARHGASVLEPVASPPRRAATARRRRAFITAPPAPRRSGRRRAWP